jgi:nucleotidyltransferase substrate binding protein (TIGR01987 family)
MQLDLTSFAKALASLEDALIEYARHPNLYVRDACIQRFEYTYEVTWKMLKRYLEQNLPNPAEVDEMSFQNLIRAGSERGLLLNGWDRWLLYRQARGTTSHAYDEIKAMEVFKQIPAFVLDAKYFLDKLRGISS